MKKLIIFGNTLMAEVMYFYFHRDSGYEIAGFTVNAEFNKKEKLFGLDVFNFETLYKTHSPSIYDLFIAVGPTQMNALRETKFNEAKSMGFSLASYISPHAVCNCPVGENCFIADMVVIAPFVEMGDNNFFYDSVVVSSHAKIGNNCYFAPNSYVGTFCNVLDNSILGAGAVLKSSITVAKKTLIGASCYVSKNTVENGVYGEKTAKLLGCISDKIDISKDFA